MDDRGAEDGHDGVADELLHRAAVPLELTAHTRVVGGELGPHVLHVEPLGLCRRPDEVDEDDRDDLALLPSRRLLDERGAAAGAEPRVVGVLATACLTDAHGASLRPRQRNRVTRKPASVSARKTVCECTSSRVSNVSSASVSSTPMLRPSRWWVTARTLARSSAMIRTISAS